MRLHLAIGAAPMMLSWLVQSTDYQKNARNVILGSFLERAPAVGVVQSFALVNVDSWRTEKRGAVEMSPNEYTKVFEFVSEEMSDVADNLRKEGNEVDARTFTALAAFASALTVGFRHVAIDRENKNG